MRLGKRLKQIEAMTGTGYNHIWDCCCDHGHLGGALLSRQAAACIHFVDILPPLIEKLSENLERFFPGGPWKTYCQDVTTIPLSEHSGKQLVIIAGVGGDLMAELVQGLLSANPDTDFDLLLCPANRPYELRSVLSQLELGVVEETLVEDNQRCYEVLKLSRKGEHPPVSLVGEAIWQPDTAQQQAVARRYLKRIVGHYQKGRSEEARLACVAYRGVEL